MKFFKSFHQPKDDKPKNPLASDGSFASSPPSLKGTEDAKRDVEDDSESLYNMTLPVSYYLRTGGEGGADQPQFEILGITGTTDGDNNTVDQRSLTSTSIKYDRQGKGYLDPTERALRNMDTENKGYLGLDSIYMIMRSLQEEQKKSAILISAIREEQKKSMSLKKSLYALCFFATLLALANIGTSFAAAKLAKDTRIASDTNDMISDSTGIRVATTPKEISVHMMAPNMDFNFTSLRRSRYLEEKHHRNLQRAMQDICRVQDDTSPSTQSSAETTNALTDIDSNDGTQSQKVAICEFVGEISYADALQIYWSFCPSWPRETQCVGGGVKSLQLICKGAVTTVYGGSYLPSSPPTDWDAITEYTIFPTRNQGYYAEQSFSNGFGQDRCVQNIDIAMYCPKDGSPCFVFASADDRCGKGIVLCGGGDDGDSQ